ncbi:uncharacterized protein [Rutidosis leptorrhynchoides]|uniref:uncharacterized protein n=1 Tax=Rutidosis leptorrhynchoides TaxID=125765 RepID=UPI003A99B35C
MDAGGRAKFSVYQNPALSTALTNNSLRPSISTFIFILSLTSASAFSLFSFIIRENDIVYSSKFRYVTQDLAYFLLKVTQAVVALVLIGSFLALIKAISLWNSKATQPASTSNKQLNLTNRQLGLLGIKSKYPQAESKPSKEPPKANSSPSNTLVPLHQSFTNSGSITRMSSGKSTMNNGNKMHSFNTPSKPPVSSFYLVPSQSPTMKTPPSTDPTVSTPWSSKRASSTKEISSEKQLETFLADFDEKFNMSAGKMATPTSNTNGFGVSSPNTNTSGTTRSTPLRPVRMSPGSQKFSTPPKKGEGDLPPPMSMEESIDAFERLGVYPQIEQWRDHLRQWFSSVLLNPLLAKIETSHVKVMDAAAKLGISVTISKIGIDSTIGAATASVSSNERNVDWQPAYTLDEESLLLQLRTTLVQTVDASISRATLGAFQQLPAQNISVPVIQDCIDIITEHLKLLALVKGEWAKGLLPQSSIRAEYTVQRIRELAAGTCVKKYEYVTIKESLNKKWTEVPTDSHLLLYLFCAFLEHPKWTLHVDPTCHAGVQSTKNPLFLGVLPPKERFPEKYLAVISGVPSVLHPGACLLTVGKQIPPIFALYWDKKPQFAFEGRTALWDSVLLLCHKIKSDYGGIVRGMHLGSSAFGILPILDEDNSE